MSDGKTQFDYQKFIKRFGLPLDLTTLRETFDARGEQTWMPFAGCGLSIDTPGRWLRIQEKGYVEINACWIRELPALIELLQFTYDEAMKQAPASVKRTDAKRAQKEFTTVLAESSPHEFELDEAS